MRDHAEPERYYDWMLWKMRQDDEQEKLDTEFGFLLKLDRGGYFCKKYPDLQKIITEILVAEKLTNERVPQLLEDFEASDLKKFRELIDFCDELPYDDDIPF